MSRHRLRARLARLERSAGTQSLQQQDCAVEFIIDPAMAKSLREDDEKLKRLRHSKSRPLHYAEAAEEERLLVSIEEKVRAIGCPADYGHSVAKDRERLRELEANRATGPLTDAEDAEELQLWARSRVFYELVENPSDPLYNAMLAWRHVGNKFRKEQEARILEKYGAKAGTPSPSRGSGG